MKIFFGIDYALFSSYLTFLLLCALPLSSTFDLYKFRITEFPESPIFSFVINNCSSLFAAISKIRKQE